MPFGILSESVFSFAGIATGALPLRPRDLPQLRQNGSITGRLRPPRPFRPLSRRSGRIPALPYPPLRCFQSGSTATSPRNAFAANGDNPLNFVSHSRGSLQTALLHHVTVALLSTRRFSLGANMDETDLLVVITEQGENRNPCEEQRNIFGFSSFSPGASKPPAPPRPNLGVVANATRRSFTAEYKLGILAEADAATADPGAIGALLRRESLYSSHLATCGASGGPAFCRA